MLVGGVLACSAGFRSVSSNSEFMRSLLAQCMADASVPSRRLLSTLSRSLVASPVIPSLREQPAASTRLRRWTSHYYFLNAGETVAGARSSSCLRTFWHILCYERGPGQRSILGVHSAWSSCLRPLYSVDVSRAIFSSVVL
ncbi:uncharacterized protein LAESUDRAFT_225647 [Laetiporus sulphureus 93-53]|uniref:Uncharacterized protein n=1 Tax=Laetiporus sulphureus 93-53 TaxID=1314785 RepID=A0A165DPL7_9APHY|nr:uncharacterized protein LAESUDRAFT_225647 [Laetiporus sulphureus 93-53]KZT05345.1 hypothetical protein LAESUDRAFT_225647 [Laetiporus sulphureus 93-53]